MSRNIASPIFDETGEGLPKIQAIGVCRFSLLVEGGFKRSPEDLAKRAVFLFDEKRLAQRFAWFRHVTLPSLKAQSDTDFRFVILASQGMGRKWRRKLRQMIAGIPQIEVDFVKPGAHHDVANAAMRSRFEPGADIIAQFRVDDDDAVARDYIARIRSDFADGLAPIFDRFNRVACDYVSGFILDADGHEAQLYQTDALNWNCAQTVYFRPDEPSALFDFGHHRLHVAMPTVTLCDSNMYVRGRHSSNDSAFEIPKFDTRPWGFEVLPERFDISLESLQAELRAID